MKYFIGVDLGTSALKLLLVDVEGTIVKSVSKEYPVFYPKTGWSEQNPQDWWEAFASAIGELVSGMPHTDLLGLSVGGQMHGLVVLDENNQVIRPAILWNDGRADAETSYLNEVVGKTILSEHTANIAFAGFTAPKILWMKNNEPELFSRISKIMLPKDYISYRLTGIHCTDYSDASGMLLLDVKNRCWSQDMLEICGITQEQMPKLYESYESVGTLLPSVAEELGLPSHITVVAGAGDNAAAALGTGTIGEGKCNISLGTSGTIFISSNSFSVDPYNALHSFCHADGGYHLMGCILSAASCNKWFCEEILKIDDFQGLQTGITDEMLGKNTVYFLPYLMGERSPINDTNARGTFVGMSMDTKQEHMLLAVMEGVAFALKDNLEIAKQQGIDITASTICGGGAKSELWQKILCNVLDINIQIPTTENGPGYGAAMLAMVGCGVYKNIRECSEELLNIKKTLVPNEELSILYQQHYEVFKKIYPTIKRLFKMMCQEG